MGNFSSNRGKDGGEADLENHLCHRRDRCSPAFRIERVVNGSDNAHPFDERFAWIDSSSSSSCSYSFLGEG